MTRIFRVVLPMVFIVAFVACSGGETVDKKTFATDVCTSAKDWVDKILEGAQTFGGGLTAESSPQEVKDGLVGFLDGVLAETNELIGEVEDAGVPDVEAGEGEDTGEEVSQALLSAFEDVKKAFETAKEEAEALPTDDQQKFLSGVQSLQATAQESLGEVGTELEDLDNEELQNEFDENQACTELENVG